MNLEIAVLLFAFANSVSDPNGDVYLPGSPGDPALGSEPDLIAGAALFDIDQQELRFEFSFSDSVFPADDFDHMDEQLWGFVDIDLDVPPVNNSSSMKSQQSGYLSNLGIEAYVDLGYAYEGEVSLFDSFGTWISDVPISFEANVVTICIPFSDLYGPGTPGNEIAYAAYFHDISYSTADVFPNGDGYLLSQRVPEPTTLTLRINESAWGSVQVDPNLPLYYDPNTTVTLTAVPIGNKTFRRWKIFDPNCPGDANYIVADANNPLALVMMSDREVVAVFKCASGMPPLPALTLGMLSLFVWIRRKA